MVPLAWPLVHWLYGPRFDASLPMVVWLLPGTYAFGMLTILSLHFAGRGYPRAANVVLAVLLNVVLNIILLPLFGTVMASITSTVTYVFVLALHIRLFRPYRSSRPEPSAARARDTDAGPESAALAQHRADAELMATVVRGGPVRRVVGAWTATSTVNWARRALLAAAALVVLDSAATLQFGYTLTLSYVLCIGACILGAPELVRRWRTLPAPVLGVAVALFVVYVAAAIAAHPATLATSQRAGTQREYVYLLDLALGLFTTMMLVATLWDRTSAAPLARALAIAGAVAGAYGVGLALRYGLPFADVNNTLDSNGIASGASQGVGLFGGARIRGTFLEPHFLGAFLAAVLPLQAWSTIRSTGRWRNLSAVGLALSAVALLLADSAAAWATLALAISTPSAGGDRTRSRSRWRSRSPWPLSGWQSFRRSPPRACWPRSPADLRPSSRTRRATGLGSGSATCRCGSAVRCSVTVRVRARSRWHTIQRAREASNAGVGAGSVGLGADRLGRRRIMRLDLLGWGGPDHRRARGRAAPHAPAGAAFAAALAVLVDIATAGDRLDPRHWLVLDYCLR